MGEAMNLIPYRIVLSLGKVIMPEEIESCSRGGSVGMWQIELRSGHIHIAKESDMRLDLLTGMKDSIGKEVYFQNDRVGYICDPGYFEMEGTICFENAKFIIHWDDSIKNDLADYDLQEIIVIGMVPFGEER